MKHILLFVLLAVIGANAVSAFRYYKAVQTLVPVQVSYSTSMCEGCNGIIYTLHGPDGPIARNEFERFSACMTAGYK